MPNVRTIPLHLRSNRGAGGSFLQIELAENAMTAHISEFPVGTYKKAHRHGAGAHVVIIGGEGYSLMWPEGRTDQALRLARRQHHRAARALVSPALQHRRDAGALPGAALGQPQASPGRWGKNYGTDESVKTGGDQIEYADEDPQIRALFEQELAKRGVACRMDDVLSAAAS